MLAVSVFWFFLAQMPGDSTWTRAGNFDSRGECEEYRLNFRVSHPNFDTQPCQREWKERT